MEEIQKTNVTRRYGVKAKRRGRPKGTKNKKKLLEGNMVLNNLTSLDRPQSELGVPVDIELSLRKDALRMAYDVAIKTEIFKSPSHYAVKPNDYTSDMMTVQAIADSNLNFIYRVNS